MDISHYDVLRNEKYGRFLVAKKNIDCGELIFTDLPFAVGPKPDTPPLCLGCYCPVDNTLCSRCGWPVCNSECEQSSQHVGECEIFWNAKVRFQRVENWTVSAPQLDCITPLRLLLAKEKDVLRWEQELVVMEVHTEARRQQPTWRIDEINIVNFLIDHCKLEGRFDKEEVQNACGILDINAVEIPSRGGFSIRAIYPRLSIAAHNCVPNIVHTILQNDYKVEVRAAVSLNKGDPLHLCYTHVLSPTLMRREHLYQSKFFHCDCPRCADPRELGTDMSTLKCHKCNNGFILSTNPLDNDAQWLCSARACGYKTPSGAIRKILAVVQAEVDQLDALVTGPQAIEQREALINKYKSVFHPRHSILLSIKHTLAQLYGRVEGYCIDDLSDLMLKRKVEVCQLVLKTLDVITPGDSRMRGMMLYESHAPLMYLAKREFSAGLITKEELKERLQEPIRCLFEAARILRREASHVPEGIIGQISSQCLIQLRASMEAL